MSARSNWDSTWQRIHDIAYPEGGDFTFTRTSGTDRRTIVHDATQTMALEKFGAVVESLLHPRNQRFQHYQASNLYLMRDAQVANFFEELTTLTFRVRNAPRAMFHDSAHESDKSLGAYGNQSFHTVPNKARNGLSYRSLHIGQVWIATDDRGFIDTTYFKWKMSAKAAEQHWGDSTPKCARDAISSGRSQEEHEYLHVVRPRRNIVPGRLGPEGMPFESWEIELKNRETIPWVNPLNGQKEETGGLNINPYTPSRFSTNSSEKYGRGPAGFVLHENESLQRMEESALLYGEHAVTPPLLSQDADLLSDGSDQLDLRPRAVNPGWLDMLGNPKVVPLQNAYNYQVNEAMMDKKKDVIADAHFLTLYQILVQTPEMTATEALIRAQEKGQLIAPMVGRQQGEWIGAVSQVELQYFWELGIMPDIPEALVEAEGEFDIEYATAATRIQREEEVQGIRATYVDLAGIAEVDPTVTEVLDAPASVRFIAEARGVPAHIIRSEEEFDEILAVQAAKAQEQEAMAAAPAMASAAKDAASAGIDVAEIVG